jgi:Ca-activated chloride channel family protein
MRLVYCFDEFVGLRNGLKVRLAGTVVWGGVLAMGCACWAQAPIERKNPSDAPVQTLKLESRLVTLSVNAVDENGSPVGGLEQKDFRVLEDGKEQKIAFFEKQSGTPLSIVLALDGSESVLRNEKLEKQAAERFVKSVVRTDAGPGGDELDLMEFADTVTEVVSFTSDRRRISDGFDHLERGDATALYDCVYLASQRLGETKQGGGRRRVLVLITDGGDTEHGVQYPQAVEQAQRAGVMIYSLIVIPIYADAGRNTGGEHALIQMADDTGGKYFYVEDAKDLGPALEKVSEDLRTQYVLGYYAPEKTPKNRNDGYRALKVELTNQDLAAKIGLRYRSGYYASK